MSTYLGIPVLIMAAIIDAAVMPHFQIGGGSPELVFLLVMAWALLVDVREAMTWAVIGGLLRDGFSVAPLGTSALGMVMVVFLVDALFGRRDRNNTLLMLLIAVAGTAIYHVVTLLVLRLTGFYVPIGRGLLYVTLPAIFFNTLLAVPVYRVVAGVREWLAPTVRRIQ